MPGKEGEEPADDVPTTSADSTDSDDDEKGHFHPPCQRRRHSRHIERYVEDVISPWYEPFVLCVEWLVFGLSGEWVGERVVENRIVNERFKDSPLPLFFPAARVQRTKFVCFIFRPRGISRTDGKPGTLFELAKQTNAPPHHQLEHVNRPEVAFQTGQGYHPQGQYRDRHGFLQIRCKRVSPEEDLWAKNGGR